MRKLLSVAIVLGVLIETAVQAQQTVVPGRSIGRISLGMPSTKVWKHLGKPTEIHFLHLAGRSYTWDEWQNDQHREFVTSYRGQVVQIERDTTYTEAQINYGDWRGSTFSVIRKQHPHLNAALYSLSQETGAVALIDDRRQGIAWSLFLLHTDDFRTGLFNTVGPDKIIVHRRGYAVLRDVGEVADEHNPLLDDLRAWCSAKS